MVRRLAAVALAFWTLGCATLEAVDQAAYESIPVNPVTGALIFNVISEQTEIQQARDAWTQLVAEAVEKGVAVDSPGSRLDRTRDAFGRLVGVAHRPSLPWEVHLVGVPVVNAFTPGGGMVIVFDGLFGGLIPAEDDDALAAVLAHEIAHVTLLHVPTRMTWSGLGPLVAKHAQDPYYQAAYTTEQEAEADRLGVLYVALAGFDPMAAWRVWEEAHQRWGSSAAQQGSLQDHPLNAERMAGTRAAASLVQQYEVSGAQNPAWETILADNVLFHRAAEVEYSPGAGLGRAIEAGGDTFVKHRQTKREEERRKAALQQLYQSIQVVRIFEAPTPDGHVGIFLDIHNGSGQEIQ
ncbi:MAG: M48 family metallopeptidase, partial [Gemmatimonadales bacterium]